MLGINGGPRRRNGGGNKSTINLKAHDGEIGKYYIQCVYNLVRLTIQFGEIDNITDDKQLYNAIH